MNSTSTADGVDLTSKGTFHRASVALSYAILLGGLLTASAAIYMVIASYSSLPSTDGWEQIEIALQGVNPLSPAWLWKQHNEHRMVIPKLFVAADLLLFRARQKLLLTSILATQFLLLILLAWSMRVLGAWRGVEAPVIDAFGLRKWVDQRTAVHFPVVLIERPDRRASMTPGPGRVVRPGVACPVSGFTVPGAGASGRRGRAGFLTVFSHKAKSRASALPAASQATSIALRKRNQASSS